MSVQWWKALTDYNTSIEQSACATRVSLSECWSAGTRSTRCNRRCDRRARGRRRWYGCWTSTRSSWRRWRSGVRWRACSLRDTIRPLAPLEWWATRPTTRTAQTTKSPQSPPLLTSLRPLQRRRRPPEALWTLRTPNDPNTAFLNEQHSISYYLTILPYILKIIQICIKQYLKSLFISSSFHHFITVRLVWFPPVNYSVHVSLLYLLVFERILYILNCEGEIIQEFTASFDVFCLNCHHLCKFCFDFASIKCSNFQIRSGSNISQ